MSEILREWSGRPSAPAARGIEPEFFAYTQVRATVVEDWLDDMIDITDRDDLDPLDKRVRIDARRWIMSKVALASDKVIIGGDGSFGGLGGGSVSLSDLSDEQLAALEALASVSLPVEEPEAVEVEEPAGDDT
jgi:hypothetical protein